MSRFSDSVGNTYKVIKNYISPSKAEELGKEFIGYVENNKVETQPTPFSLKLIGKGYELYNFPKHLNLLSCKTSDVGELIGSDVNPSYSFSRVYVADSELVPHTDRPSCEVSLSIHLWGDEEWAFCIEDINGETVEVVLEPGDAILYDGCNASHWRPGKYAGEKFCQVFHHYVYVEGEFSNYAFDPAGLSTKANRIESVALEKYINVWDDLVTPELLNTINTRMDHVDNWERASTVGDDTEYRKCYSYQLKSYLPEDKELDEKLFGVIGNVFARLNANNRFLNLSEDDGYKLLKYPGGDFNGKYENHTDHSSQHNRFFTIIIMVNDDYEGGDLTFFCGLKKIDTKAGRVITFPSAYLFPHAVAPTISGERRSIITWAR